MPGVPRELAEHTLNVDPKFKPVRQFLRRFNEERRKAIGEEVARLLTAGFIVEAEPISKCDAATAVQFMKKVIFRFGFPHSIITDNGTNLSKGAMEEFF